MTKEQQEKMIETAKDLIDNMLSAQYELLFNEGGIHNITDLAARHPLYKFILNDTSINRKFMVEQVVGERYD